ncbi:MAG: UDP-N-acetylglucosamine 2-epimerase (non-hydrolyzing) [Synergistaceae bacterium]|nr:UDP-N-acetylglucosamine 2-epimerase (non-hydrolyzing) [Synergistaceae bacterium]
METKKIKILSVVGTRPEAIKMAPLILELKNDPFFDAALLASGQHSDMLSQALSHFGLTPDENLKVMKERQTLEHITSSVLVGVGAFLDANPQDMLLTHGDTTTTLAASLAGFYRKTPIGHVEAGLRSRDMSRPFPEEANRVLTDRLCSLHFAPTGLAAENLRAEGVSGESVFVTGNTVIDALFWTLAQNGEAKVLRGIPEEAPLALLTAHRRESWGEPLARICRAVRRLMEKHPELRLIVPLHKNPEVRNTITDILNVSGSKNIVFTEPLEYPEFVAAMNRSLFIMSDSGGVQEEASALKKPVLILREISERPEALDQGTGLLVGSDEHIIEREASRLLEDISYRESFTKRGGGSCPFGDGNASKRIADILKSYFSGRVRERFNA